MSASSDRFLNLILNSIDIIGGEIGGVGKSTFAKLLLDYFVSIELDFYVVDADKSTPNVGTAYAADDYTAFAKNNNSGDGYRAESEDKEFRMKRIILGDSMDAQYAMDHLFELAERKRTVLALPSRAMDQVGDWIKLNNLGDSANSDYPVNIWFVSNGIDESLKLLKQSIVQTGVPHILVKNKGNDNATNWQRQEDSSEYQKFIESLGLAAIVEFGGIPLDIDTRDNIRKNNRRFCDIKAELPKPSLRRLNLYLDRVFDSIAATGKVPTLKKKPSSPGKEADKPQSSPSK